MESSTCRPFSDLVLEAIARVLHDEIVVSSCVRYAGLFCSSCGYKGVELFSVATEVAGTVVDDVSMYSSVLHILIQTDSSVPS
jgi:hypothetical protein